MLGMLGWAAFQPVFYSSSPFLSLANNLPCSLSANPLGWLFVLWTLLSWSTSFPPRSSGNCWFHYLSSHSYLLNGSFIKGKSRVWFHALCHRPLPTPGSGCGFVLNEFVKWNQIRFSLPPLPPTEVPSLFLLSCRMGPRLLCDSLPLPSTVLWFLLRGPTGHGSGNPTFMHWTQKHTPWAGTIVCIS